MSYFIDICVICLKSSNNLKHIKTQDANGRSFEDKLIDFVPGYELDLNIPVHICAQCGRNLNKIHEFKQKCLRNKTTYKKYAQQVTTTGSSYKYLSVFMHPNLVYVKKEPFDENIVEAQSEMNNEEVIVKEETELVLDNELASLVHEIKKEDPIDENAQISVENKNIKQELERHTSKLPCEICNKSFNISYLNTHKLLHTGERPFTCEVCNKSFTTLSNLNRHKAVHTDGGVFTCEVCNKSFNNLSCLKKHEYIHTGQKPFPCEVCNKSFTRRTNLKTHKRLHTGERPFTCEICNKSFTFLSNLKAHKLMHTSKILFTCDVCGKSMNRIGNLKMQKHLHTGEKPFTCETCNKSFLVAQKLNEHKRIHTGEKPYTCEFCNKSFRFLQVLKPHKLVCKSKK